MESLVRSAMTSSPARAAQLIGSSHQYIKDNNFCNLLQNIDINAPKKFNYSLFRAFDAVPDLQAQVRAWLASAR